MKSKSTEKTAAKVARKFVEKTLDTVFDRVRAYRLVLIQDPKQESKTRNKIIFADLRLMGKVRHRFTLTLEKVSGQWTVVTAAFNSFTSTGSAIQGSIRRIEVGLPKPKKIATKKTRARKPASPKPVKVAKKAPAPVAPVTTPAATMPEKQDGLVYAKVIRVGGDTELIVEHRLGKRVIFIEEGQPFYGTTTHLGRPREGMAPIRLGDTIAYRPDKSPAGNHTFVGLPKDK